MSESPRFSLHSLSTSSFQVTISKLEAGDAGIYWCGSDSEWSVADYTKIDLSVGEVNMYLYGQNTVV